MRRRPIDPPVPPREMPPARTVLVPGRGEFFLRDSGLSQPGGDPRPPVLLLHGWVVTADLNWLGAYDALVAAGHRVLAIDHRGHGRGLRSTERFRLADCAADAAGVLRTLQTGPATVVGYSLGGTVAQLMARDHADVVSGVVLSGTWTRLPERAVNDLRRWMGLVALLIKLAPRTFYASGFRRQGIERGEGTAWMLGELMRHSGRDIAEAGREIGRFDSRSWLAEIGVPAAVVLTARDRLVPPRCQRELAEAIGAREVVEVALDHLELTVATDVYNPALLQAIAAVGAAAPAPAP